MASQTAPNPSSTTGKRTRPLTPSRRSSSSIVSTSSRSTSSSLSSPETKIARSSTSPGNSPSGGSEKRPRPILCTLPPTCNRHPITLANSKEMERHYANYHAHVCEQPGCGCVFPEARLLELHQTECHDPLAAVRKERGEKTFGCLVQTCPKLFQSPKARRLHMIEAHKYPKEFFFAVTNKGIGGLLRKWGEGASMIRGEWKPRDDQGPDKTKEKVGGNDKGDRMLVEDEEESSSEEEDQQSDTEEVEKTPRPGVRSLHPVSPPRGSGLHAASANANTDIDALAEGMSSLTLIPSSIRFGRGGRSGGLGLGTRGRGRGGRGGIVPPQGAGGGHQRRASVSSVPDKGGPGGAGTKSRGGKRGGKGHRVSASIGTGMEVNMSGVEGGDVVLLPPGGGESGRGGRSRRDTRRRAH